MKLHALCSQFKRFFTTKRAAVDTDVLIVGGGPAGLSTAIKIKQLSPSIRVILLEKGSAIGMSSINLCNTRFPHSVRCSDGDTGFG